MELMIEVNPKHRKAAEVAAELERQLTSLKSISVEVIYEEPAPGELGGRRRFKLILKSAAQIAPILTFLLGLANTFRPVKPNQTVITVTIQETRVSLPATDPTVKRFLAKSTRQPEDTTRKKKKAHRRSIDTTRPKRSHR
jgi:hypothetical protein